MKNDCMKFILAELQNKIRKIDHKLMFLLNSELTVQYQSGHVKKFSSSINQCTSHKLTMTEKQYLGIQCH